MHFLKKQLIKSILAIRQLPQPSILLLELLKQVVQSPLLKLLIRAGSKVASSVASEVGDGFAGVGGCFVAVVFVDVAKVVGDALGLRCIGLKMVAASLGMGEVKVLRYPVDVEQCKMLL